MASKKKDETVNLNLQLSGMLGNVDREIEYLDDVRKLSSFSLSRDMSIELANVRKAYVEARKGIVAAIGYTVPKA